MLQEVNILSQLNTDLCRTHKGVGQEASIRKDLKRVERERDDAREIVRALSDETESLRQNLQLSETRRVDVEENLLNSAEYDAELVGLEHTRKLIAIGTKWGERLEESLDQDCKTKTRQGESVRSMSWQWLKLQLDTWVR